MRKIIAALVLALVPILFVPSTAGASDFYQVKTVRKYRCAPGYSVCRLQVKRCTYYYIAPGVSHAPVCTRWRFVSYV